MSIDSYGALHEFLFQLRTPLAGLRGVASFANKAETIGISVPPEAHEWLTKWLPKVNRWYEEAVELTNLFEQAKSEDHDWKRLVQRLISTLAEVEEAAREARNIPQADIEVVGDVARLLVHLINCIDNHYKYMRDVFPELV